MSLVDFKTTNIIKSRHRSQSSHNPTVSVIVTVQDLQAELKILDTNLHKALSDYHDFEIIYVDDGSVDGSWSKLKAIAEESAHVRLIRLRTRFGESSALDAGLRSAKGNHILYFTCRVRINPYDLKKFLQKLDDGYDVVIGVRYPRRDSGLNKAVSRLFNYITNKVTNLNLHDINSGVLAIKKDAEVVRGGANE